MIEVDNNLSILLGSGNIGNVPAQTLCADKWEKLDFSGTIPSDRTVSQTARFENKVKKFALKSRSKCINYNQSLAFIFSL
jgi:hypothetical protein